MTSLLTTLGLTVAVFLFGAASGGLLAWAQSEQQRRSLKAQLIEARAELAVERENTVALHADLVEANANRAKSNT